jgi:hypothetical protein
MTSGPLDLQPDRIRIIFSASREPVQLALLEPHSDAGIEETSSGDRVALGNCQGKGAWDAPDR